MGHNKIAPLTVQELSALANRFKARAESVLLRDQPQMQSDMRLAARLIYELIGNALTIEDQPRMLYRVSREVRATDENSYA